MDQLLCPPLSPTHYWYKVGMLKVVTCRPTIMKTDTGLLQMFLLLSDVGRVFEKNGEATREQEEDMPPESVTHRHDQTEQPAPKGKRRHQRSNSASGHSRNNHKA